MVASDFGELSRVATTLLIFLLIGCSETRTYRITVRNATDTPITIGFVKDGPPHEPQWTSPEELSDLPPSRQPAHWGQPLDPDHKATTTVQGRFESRTRAFLRIYLGLHPTDELLAMSRGTGTRTDVLLQSGAGNDFTVTTQAGRLTAHLTSTPRRSP